MQSGVEGYASQSTPPSGDLPNTGADAGSMFAVGVVLVAFGVMLWAAITNARRSQPTPEHAPAYIQSPVLPSTWNEE